MSNSAAVLYSVGDVRIEARPEPAAGPGRVVVDVQAVGICGSDVHYFQHGRIGSYVVEAPMIIGHEAAGIIIATGAGVSETRIGELVALEPGVPDFTCEQCVRGRYNLCPNIQFFATPPVDGAMVQRLAVPASFAHPAPAGLTAEYAAMAEPVSVGVWACRKASVSPGDRVLVTGAGAIGLLTAQVARSFGASAVTVTDTNPLRLAVAESLGFTSVLATAPLSGVYDVLLECSGAASALSDGLEHMAPAGRAVLIGMGSDAVTINVPLLQGAEISLTGVFRYAHCYPTALDLIAKGEVNLKPIITHRFGIADTIAALSLPEHDPTAIKAIVYPDD